MADYTLVDGNGTTVETDDGDTEGKVHLDIDALASTTSPAITWYMALQNGTNNPVKALLHHIRNAMRGGIETLTYNASTTIDLSTAKEIFELELTGNVTIDFSNLVAGKMFVLFLKQDATGSRTASWAAKCCFEDDEAFDISTAASATDLIVGIVEDSTHVHLVLCSKASA